MLRLAALLLIATMTIASDTKFLTFTDLTGRPRPAPDATIAYGADPLQRGDLWLPRGKGPFPIVLLVHGGCWQTSIADRRYMSYVADNLRRSGIAVWNIDYRGVDRAGGGYPGTFQDVAMAADQLTELARRYPLDLTRVAAIGHSAGGHLALWLAARPRLPADSILRTPAPLPIGHVVSLGGLPDLELTARSPDNGCGTDVVARLVGTARTDPYADTSLPRLLPLGVPQDLVNGHDDHIIPLRLAIDYTAKAAGEARLHTIPNTDHFELVAPETPAWAEANRLILAALTPPRHGERNRRAQRDGGGGSPRTPRQAEAPHHQPAAGPPPHAGED